ncbi:MAG: signal peptide peptidase SppA [Gammaproteobacteria bacterium]|nr:signal peptide peptidase SppA [Gammaproteobacteria bacterium]|tara:strand:+ start:1198 stop:3030 length:1833 start_codon:yes stop_codon:yes gene_type:complete
MFIKFLRFCWRFIDVITRLFQFFFFLIICLIIVVIFYPSSYTPASNNIVLNLNLQGNIVEDFTTDEIDRLIINAQGLPASETRLRDVITSIRYAKDDDKIVGILLNTENLSSAGLSKLQDISRELISFKLSGKPIISVSNHYTQNQYYLASHASKVYIKPFGVISMTGYNKFIPYYKSGLENFGVEANVWSVGEYKSFVEPYTRDVMSDEDKQSSEAYLNGLWDDYKNDVSLQRGLDTSAVQDFVDNYASNLELFNGDNVALAVHKGFIDQISLNSDIDKILKAEFKLENEINGKNLMQFNDYLSLFSTPIDNDIDKIAIVSVSGPIIDEFESLSASVDSVSNLIKKATNDKDIKALVLRVDSPGGSISASAAILDQLIAFQETDRPLVVSMSSVAASGGYWISMSADEIWASSSTLTGSIGVGAIIPTFQEALNKLGITVDGIGTTKLSGQLNLSRELGQDVQKIIKQNIDFSYQYFIESVARYREKSFDEVDSFSRGRVWTGRDAINLGLVDKIGSLDDAISSAANMASISSKDFHIEFLNDDSESFINKFSLSLMKVFYPIYLKIIPSFVFSSKVDAYINDIVMPLKFIEYLSDPKEIYSFCLCSAS